MSFSSDMDKEIAIKYKDIDNILASAAFELKKALEESSPVDSGELSKSWQEPEKESDMVYTVKNIAPHGIIIDGGRRLVGNKMQGSEQLPFGYTPIVQKVESKINRKLRSMQ